MNKSFISSFTDMSVDESDADVEDGDAECLDIEETIKEKFSCHMDSMKRYKKQVTTNKNILERDETKEEIGV